MSSTKTRLVNPFAARKIYYNMAASGESDGAVKLTKEDIPGASLEVRLPSQKIEERNSGSMSWRLLQRTPLNASVTIVLERAIRSIISRWPFI